MNRCIVVIFVLLNCINNFIYSEKQLIVSYSILSHNETSTLDNLLDVLVKNKDIKDEIVVIDDFSTNMETLQILDKYRQNYDVKVHKRALNLDFAQQRNFAKKTCKGQYIFWIDSDEEPSLYVIKNIRNILKTNSDGYMLPEIHLISDLPKDMPGVVVNKKGWVFWPDYHLRIFKNKTEVNWKNPVHEMLEGIVKIEKMPAEEHYAIIERKSYKKWENSHVFYLNCYKKWILNELKNNNKKLVKDLLIVNPHAHLTFLIDSEGLAVLNNYKNSKTIENMIKELLIKPSILYEEVGKIIDLLLS